MNKVKLGEVLDVKRGASLSGDYYSESGEKIRLTLGNFDYPNGGFKENTSKSDIYFTGEVKPEFILKKGDIITPLTEQVAGLLGETARIPEGDLYIQSGDVGLVIPNESKLDNKYAYYLLASPLIKRQLGAAAQQTKIRHTSPDKIKDCEAWLPSLEYQKKAGELLDDINFKMKCNNKINAELESMAKTIYDYWFLQFEFPNEEGKPYKSSGGKMVWNEELKREIPESWEVKVIEDFCRIFTGKKDVNQALESGEYKFFSCSPEYKYSNEKLHSGKAILVSGNGSYTGRTIFVNDSFDLYQRTYACVSSTDKDLLEYIYYSMLRVFTQKVGGGTHGSAIPYIVFDDIAKEPVLYNADIVEKYQKIVIPLQEKIIKNQRENEELTSLRDFLLPMLMNGQIGFKDGE